MTTAMYAYIQHALQLNYCREPTDSRQQDTRRGGAAAAGRTKLLPYYCKTHETPGAPEDTRGDQEGHQRDRRTHGGSKRHQEDRRAQRGDRERDPEDRREQWGMIGAGAGRKATRTQHPLGRPLDLEIGST